MIVLLTSNALVFLPGKADASRGPCSNGCWNWQRCADRWRHICDLRPRCGRAWQAPNGSRTSWCWTEMLAASSRALTASFGRPNSRTTLRRIRCMMVLRSQSGREKALWAKLLPNASNSSTFIFIIRSRSMTEK